MIDKLDRRPEGPIGAGEEVVHNEAEAAGAAGSPGVSAVSVPGLFFENQETQSYTGRPALGRGGPEYCWLTWRMTSPSSRCNALTQDVPLADAAQGAHAT
jgi:hypothetical protein